MIPVYDYEEIVADMEEYIEPSYTYMLDFENKRITGFVDEKKAIEQAIHKMLQTERNAYMIYGTVEGIDYGIELNRLIGKDMSFVTNDIERTIEEALLNDERILSIEDFQIIEQKNDRLYVSFVVKSVFGNISIEEVAQL